MERFTIAPEIVDKLNTTIKEPRVWRGRFWVPIRQVQHMRSVLEASAFKRSIVVHLDDVDENARRVYGSISYGPVKGANKNDMDRWIAHFDGQIVESFGTSAD